MEAGPVKPAPMGGYEALDWKDVSAYASLIGFTPDEWDPFLVVRLSRSYMNGMNEGTSPFSIAPIDRIGALDEDDDD